MQGWEIDTLFQELLGNLKPCRVKRLFGSGVACDWEGKREPSRLENAFYVTVRILLGGAKLGHLAMRLDI